MCGASVRLLSIIYNLISVREITMTSSFTIRCSSCRRIIMSSISLNANMENHGICKYSDCRQKYCIHLEKGVEGKNSKNVRYERIIR